MRVTCGETWPNTTWRPEALINNKGPISKIWREKKSFTSIMWKSCLCWNAFQLLSTHCFSEHLTNMLSINIFAICNICKWSAFPHYVIWNNNLFPITFLSKHMSCCNLVVYKWYCQETGMFLVNLLCLF